MKNNIKKISDNWQRFFLSDGEIIDVFIEESEFTIVFRVDEMPDHGC